MEMLTPELISGVGSGGAVLFLSIYFLRSFIDYQKSVIGDILTEMKADRQVFQEAVSKLDARLHLIEKLIEREKQ
jgi:hypothetical protein